MQYNDTPILCSNFYKIGRVIVNHWPDKKIGILNRFFVRECHHLGDIFKSKLLTTNDSS